MNGLTFRSAVTPADEAAVDAIVRSTGFFSEEEAEVAAELVRERLEKGIESGYYFVFAERDGDVAGYACFGPIPLTRSGYDLYWIAVSNTERGRGIGRLIMAEVESEARKLGGERIYADTSSREQYAPTRGFYESCGMGVAAVFEEFYTPGDSKVVYSKKL